MITLKHFKPYEFVDETIYKKRGDKAIEMMDREILLAMDSLHDLLSEHYGTKVAIEINTWFWGGDKDGRGYRTAEHPEYSNTSQHKGSAIDFKVKVNGFKPETLACYRLKSVQRWRVHPNNRRPS